jgi:hypothetical protein
MMYYPTLKSLQPLLLKAWPYLASAGVGAGVTLLITNAKDNKDRRLRQEKERLLKAYVEKLHARTAASTDEIDAIKERENYLSAINEEQHSVIKEQQSEKEKLESIIFKLKSDLAEVQ